MAEARKQCCVCDKNLAGQKRVKDGQGHYYCQPCWEKAQSVAEALESQYSTGKSSLWDDEIDTAQPISRSTHPPHDQPAGTSDYVDDASIGATSDAPYSPAHSVRKPGVSSPKTSPPKNKGDRLTTGERSIIFGGILVGILVIVGVLYFFVYRDRWENQNRPTLLAMKTDAESLTKGGKLPEAKVKLDQLFKLLGDRAVRDANLELALKSARQLANKVDADLAAKETAIREAGERTSREAEEKRLAEIAARERAEKEGEKRRLEQERLSQSRGNAQALVTKATAILKRDPSVQQDREAVSLLQQAAEQENVEAIALLGTLHSIGRGVEKDSAEAVRWFIRAANRGDAGAMTAVAIAYEEGDGVAKDEAEAARWYMKADQAGDYDGTTLLALMYLEGRGVSKDTEQAQRLYRRAASAKQPVALFMLGEIYRTGNGVTKDEAEAAKWYEKAANAGNVGAMYFLGKFYHDGRGLPQDYRTAMQWYMKAAEKGDGAAAYNIAAMYGNGFGVRQDAAETLRWFRRAQQLGYEKAEVGIRQVQQNIAGVLMAYAEDGYVIDDCDTRFNQLVALTEKWRQAGDPDNMGKCIEMNKKTLALRGASLEGMQQARQVLGQYPKEEVELVRRALLNQADLDARFRPYLQRY